MMVIKLQTWKRRKRKTKLTQGKGIFDRSILFCHSRHQVGVSEFRIDSRTIKRGESRLNGYQVPLGAVVLAYALGPSVLTINP